MHINTHTHTHSLFLDRYCIKLTAAAAQGPSVRADEVRDGWMERGWGEDPHVYSGWVTGLVLLHYYYYEYYEYSLSPLSHSQLLFHRHLPLAAIISNMGLRPWLWLSMIVKTNKLYEHPIDWDWIIITCDSIQHSSTKSRKYSSLCSCKQVTVFTIQSLFLVSCFLPVVSLWYVCDVSAEADTEVKK